MEVENSDLQVIFAAGGHRFSVPFRVVEQMVTPPAVVRVPNVHPAVRGVVNLRGVVLGMVDLRTLIGAPTATDEARELAAELDRHLQAHHDWLHELEAATAEGRPFSLPTDPTACDFGRWYADFRPGNLQLRMLLSQMDRPHRRIHELAEQTQLLTLRGQREEAQALIARTSGTDLSGLRRLLEEARGVVLGAQRDIALVLSLPGHTPLALLVDTVDAVAALSRVNVADQGADNLGGLIAGLATDREGALVAALDVEALYVLLS